MRGVYIYNVHIEVHGATPTCSGCRLAVAGDKHRAKHTDAKPGLKRYLRNQRKDDGASQWLR